MREIRDITTSRPYEIDFFLNAQEHFLREQNIKILSLQLKYVLILFLL